jgi:hypothetical protein
LGRMVWRERLFTVVFTVAAGVLDQIVSCGQNSVGMPAILLDRYWVNENAG